MNDLEQRISDAFSGIAINLVKQLSCTKSGTIFKLTGTLPKSGIVKCEFTAYDIYHYGDVFEVNGTLYTTMTTNSVPLAEAAFFNGFRVSVDLDIPNKKLYIETSTPSGCVPISGGNITDELTIKNVKVATKNSAGFTPVNGWTMDSNEAIPAQSFAGYIVNVYGKFIAPQAVQSIIFSNAKWHSISTIRIPAIIIRGSTIIPTYVGISADGTMWASDAPAPQGGDVLIFSGSYTISQEMS
jgi:hypothetical protein